MSFKDALAKARAARPEPTLVGVAVGDELYNVEVVRLDGMDWAAIAAMSPVNDKRFLKIGFNPINAALLACAAHSRLLDANDEPVEDVDWAELFTAISGEEVRAIAASWWGRNVNDPNTRVEALKKALAGGERTSLN